MFLSDSITSKYDKCNECSNRRLECEDGMYRIQDFVADYIQYRIHIHGNRKVQNLVNPCRQGCENGLIRSVALIFEEKHKEELQKMVEILCENESFSCSQYIEIMEQFVCIHNESPSQMSYGRLIALIAFAGLIATRLIDMKYFAEVSMVMSYTSKFLHKRIALTWPYHKRSWVRLHYVSKFFDLARTIIKLNKTEKAESKVEKNEWRSAVSGLAVFGVVSIVFLKKFALYVCFVCLGNRWRKGQEAETLLLCATILV
uniref:Bcl-2 Bcl-2 homology region 1-3 domain-containing protein n=1 Tax=Wuchereria bancrofti TaxID=6293 RepID=A0A1I8E8Y7_WUCBA